MLRYERNCKEMENSEMHNDLHNERADETFAIIE